MSKERTEMPAGAMPKLPVTYRNPWVVIPGGISFLCLALLIGWAAVEDWKDYQRSPATVVLGSMTILCVALGSRLLRLGLEVTESGLIVRNLFRTRDLPWSDVEGFRAEKAEEGPYGAKEPWALVIDLFASDSVEVMALQGKRYVQKVCPTLEAVRERVGRRPEPSSGNRPMAEKRGDVEQEAKATPAMPVTYRNVWMVISLAAAAVVIALLSGWMVVAEWRTPLTPLWFRAVILIATAIAAVLAIRLLRLGLTATESGVIVRNPLRTWRLSWNQVEAFRAVKLLGPRSYHYLYGPIEPKEYWTVTVDLKPFDSVEVRALSARRGVQVRQVCAKLELIRKRLGCTPSASFGTPERKGFAKVLRPEVLHRFFGRIAER